MTLNRVRLGRAVIFTKHLASVVSLIFLPKTLIWNKLNFPASNSLNLAELVVYAVIGQAVLVSRVKSIVVSPYKKCHPHYVGKKLLICSFRISLGGNIRKLFGMCSVCHILYFLSYFANLCLTTKG